MAKELPKVIFVVGQTASGKTALALDLAHKFNGVIINADSRQVYKEMDIITAKPKRDSVESEKYLVDGIEHYLFDMFEPDQIFTLIDFKIAADKAIAEILKQKKVPIVVGGTGLYMQALIENLDIPKAQVNWDLRAELEDMPVEELLMKLQKEDPDSFEVIDIKNKRRVLRALEVLMTTGRSFVDRVAKTKPIYQCLQIGIRFSRPEIYERINQRIDEQMKDGALEETKKLVEKYPLTLPSMTSIGYRQLAQYLKGEISLEKAVEDFKLATRQYAKRQETWFKRDKKIIWIEGDRSRSAEEVEKFLQK